MKTTETIKQTETFTNEYGKVYTRDELEKDNEMLCKLTGNNPASYWDMPLDQLYICNGNLYRSI